MPFSPPTHEPVIVAVTGASGAPYALRLIARLANAGVTQHLLFSDAAKIVLQQECHISLPQEAHAIPAALADALNISAEQMHSYADHDWFSPVASGSAGLPRMVIAPCSMGTLARIASGISGTLIERAADVILKESRQLILLPRETPLSTIHLENMLKLARMGAEIIPAMPGFYHRPDSIETLIDFVVDRILDHLHICNKESPRWGA
ncbi:MAG: UbiX family flavin prenyltransferase [Zetaproteobacteria bacterium]|nr:UbiX family flavin prenyltransferase [Zetaproteobacteria bacterium]